MLQFDEKGHLMPYEIIELTLSEFETSFVDGLDDRTHRRGLFQKYLSFLEDLKVSLGVPFYQWVDGSFVTTKVFPGDIDLVIFLDYDWLVKKMGVILDYKNHSHEKYKVDAHFAPFANRRHRFYSNTLKMEADWRHTYGTSRPENGIRHPKGIVKIDFL